MRIGRYEVGRKELAVLVVVVILAVALAVGVYLVKRQQEIETRARLGLALRISHVTCEEMLVVLPSAPEGLADSSGTAVMVGPNGERASVNLVWRGYDGPVAKWVAQSGVWYRGDGRYVVEAVTAGGFSGMNTPYEANLSCAGGGITPTVTVTPVPTVTVAPTPIPTPTPTGVGGDPVPTVTVTPVPTATGVPVPTSTPIPELTSTPTANPTSVPTAMPSIAATGTPTPTTPSVGGGSTATPTAALLADLGSNTTPVVPVSGEAWPTLLLLSAGMLLIVFGGWMWGI